MPRMAWMKTGSSTELPEPIRTEPEERNAFIIRVIREIRGFSFGTRLKNLFLLPALIAGLGLIPADRVTAEPFTVLHSFTATDPNTGANSDGADPDAGLFLSGNTLYGTALTGGPSGFGTVFAVNTDGTGFTNLHSFAGGSDGAGPRAGLILSGDTLYGTARGNGSSPIDGNGTVYKVTTNGTGFTNLHSFTSGAGAYPNVTNSDGASPSAGLILLGNTLYGTARSGGSSGNGTVFAINTDGKGFTNLHSFDGVSDGAIPFAGLITNLSGNTLYGTASAGGDSGNGTVFALNTDGTGFTNLHSFTASDGANPYAGLILSGNTLYGTAAQAGSSGNGTVFAINTDGTGFRTPHSFTAESGPLSTNSDGAYPFAGLILSGNTLYGPAEQGGSSAAGTVFAVNTYGAGFATLYSFATVDPVAGTNSDGAYPNGALVLSGNNLYGTAYGGGNSGSGTVFSLLLPRPRLTITFSGAYPVVSWPAIYSGEFLQYTTDALSPSAVWYDLPYLPIIVNGQIAVTVPAYLFLREHAAFRLHHD